MLKFNYFIHVYIYIMYLKMSSVFVDPLPYNKGNPLTKASGREDLIYCLYRLTLVKNFFLKY